MKQFKLSIKYSALLLLVLCLTDIGGFLDRNFNIETRDNILERRGTKHFNERNLLKDERIRARVISRQRLSDNISQKNSRATNFDIERLKADIVRDRNDNLQRRNLRDFRGSRALPERERIHRDRSIRSEDFNENRRRIDVIRDSESNRNINSEHSQNLNSLQSLQQYRQEIPERPNRNIYARQLGFTNIRIESKSELGEHRAYSRNIYGNEPSTRRNNQFETNQFDSSKPMMDHRVDISRRENTGRYTEKREGTNRINFETRTIRKRANEDTKRNIFHKEARVTSDSHRLRDLQTTRGLQPSSRQILQQATTDIKLDSERFNFRREVTRDTENSDRYSRISQRSSNRDQRIQGNLPARNTNRRQNQHEERDGITNRCLNIRDLSGSENRCITNRRINIRDLSRAENRYDRSLSRNDRQTNNIITNRLSRSISSRFRFQAKDTEALERVSREMKRTEQRRIVERRDITRNSRRESKENRDRFRRELIHEREQHMRDVPVFRRTVSREIQGQRRNIQRQIPTIELENRLPEDQERLSRTRANRQTEIRTTTRQLRNSIERLNLHHRESQPLDNKEFRTITSERRQNQREMLNSRSLQRFRASGDVMPQRKINQPSKERIDSDYRHIFRNNLDQGKSDATRRIRELKLRYLTYDAAATKSERSNPGEILNRSQHENLRMSSISNRTIREAHESRKQNSFRSESIKLINLLDNSRQSRKLQDDFYSHFENIDYVPALNSSQLLNAAKVILATFLFAQIFSNSKKSHKFRFSNFTFFNKDKVL